MVDKIEYRNAANALVGTDDFTYNDLLQRTSGTGRYGVNNAWTYDDRGRMLTESTTYSGQTYQVGYRYDSRGRLDEITYPSGRKAAYTFDQRSALDLIKWENSIIEDRGYVFHLIGQRIPNCLIVSRPTSQGSHMFSLFMTAEITPKRLWSTAA